MRFLPKVHKLGKLRVILVPEERESVTVRVMLGTGSREEIDKEAGSAHFLEHFVFKGTREFPGMTDVTDAIEKVGGTYNAYTGQNEMGFWTKVDKKNIDLAMKIVGQLVTEPILPKEHFDKERGTILEELYMYEDRPNSKALEECEKLVFGNTNLGRPIIGTVESLKAMTVEELRKYFEKWFVAENMVLGVVGGMGDEEKVLELVRKEFGKIIDDERKMPEKNVFAWDTQNKVRETLVSRKVEQAAVFMGFRGLAMNDERRYVMEILNIIYGGGSMSRLFREVREERGWAYAIGSDSEMYTDTGMVLVGAGLPKSKLNEAVKLMTEISFGLGGDSKWAITEEEIKIAKQTFRGRLALEFDKPEEVLGSALEDATYREKIYTPEEILAKIDDVTLADVLKLAKEIFVPEKMSIAVVGNYDKLDFKI